MYQSLDHLLFPWVGHSLRVRVPLDHIPGKADLSSHGIRGHCTIPDTVNQKIWRIWAGKDNQSACGVGGIVQFTRYKSALDVTSLEGYVSGPFHSLE